MNIFVETVVSRSCGAVVSLVPCAAVYGVWTRELHGDGDDGIPAESAGIPRGWK